MFLNISQVSFKMAVSHKSIVKLKVQLLDMNKNVVYEEIVNNNISGVNNDTYDPNPKIINFNASGAHYLRFVIDGTNNADRTVNIDDVSIVTTASNYSSTFSSGEYTSFNAYATEEELVEAINDYSFDWKLYNARMNYNNSKGNLNNADKSNLALAIRRNNGVNGYAYINNSFTSIKSVELDLKTTAYSNDNLVVSLVKVSDDSVVSSKTIKNTTNDYTRINSSLLTFDYSGEAVYLMFEISTSTNDNKIYIDNLNIEF